MINPEDHPLDTTDETQLADERSERERKKKKKIDKMKKKPTLISLISDSLSRKAALNYKWTPKAAREKEIKGSSSYLV